MSPQEVLLDSLDRMSCGGLFLDAAGGVLRFNSLAERCLARHTSSDRSEAKSNGWATQALRQLLGSAIRLKNLKVPFSVRGVTGRALIVHAVPIPVGQDENAASLLILFDLDECLRPSEEMLRDAFELTRAEARLAARLACGESLQDIADAFGISPGTARMQLKAVFAKTRTCRQAELVALLSRLALASWLACLSEIASALEQRPPHDQGKSESHTT